jgi:hypothetical protein
MKDSRVAPEDLRVFKPVLPRPQLVRLCRPAPLLSAFDVAARLGVDSNDYKVSREVYNANATANDTAIMAEEPGITEDDVERCRNPRGDIVQTVTDLVSRPIRAPRSRVLRRLIDRGKSRPLANDICDMPSPNSHQGLKPLTQFFAGQDAHLTNN